MGLGRFNFGGVFIIGFFIFLAVACAPSFTGSVTGSDSNVVVSSLYGYRGINFDGFKYNYRIRMAEIDKSGSEPVASLEVKLSDISKSNSLLNTLSATATGVKKGEIIYYCSFIEGGGVEKWFATRDISECGNSDKDVWVEVLDLLKDPINGVYKIEYTISELN